MKENNVYNKNTSQLSSWGRQVASWHRMKGGRLDAWVSCVLGMSDQCKAHSYRRAFFPKFPKFGNNWRYVSIYGGVLPPFVKFSRRIKNIKFVNIPILGKNKTRKICKIEKLSEKNVEEMDKKLSDKNDAAHCRMAKEK